MCECVCLSGGSWETPGAQNETERDSRETDWGWTDEDGERTTRGAGESTWTRRSFLTTGRSDHVTVSIPSAGEWCRCRGGDVVPAQRETHPGSSDRGAAQGEPASVCGPGGAEPTPPAGGPWAQRGESTGDNSPLRFFKG